MYDVNNEMLSFDGLEHLQSFSKKSNLHIRPRMSDLERYAAQMGVIYYSTGGGVVLKGSPLFSWVVWGNGFLQTNPEWYFR